jgi:hypothetical protein
MGLRVAHPLGVDVEGKEDEVVRRHLMVSGLEGGSAPVVVRQGIARVGAEIHGRRFEPGDAADEKEEDQKQFHDAPLRVRPDVTGKLISIGYECTPLRVTCQ